VYLSVELGFIVCFLHFMHICHARHYSTLRNVHYRKRRRRRIDGLTLSTSCKFPTLCICVCARNYVVCSLLGWLAVDKVITVIIRLRAYLFGSPCTRTSCLHPNTLQPCPHCRRKVRLSPKTAKFGDCRTFLRQCGQALRQLT